MNSGHAHPCQLCGVSKMCSRADCLSLGLPIVCVECSKAIAEVDALPSPKRPRLSFTDVAEVVRRGTLAAVEIAASDPERCLEVFRSHVRCLLPVPGRVDADAFARSGAVEGALAAWTGQWSMPSASGALSVEASLAYKMAYTGAVFVVQSVRG